MLKLYGSEKSRAFRVLWLLEELGIPYEHHSLIFANEEHLSEEFLKLNPSGKVPVLTDGNQIIHESSAILLHLMDHYGQESELAIKPGQRTELYQWLFYGSSELEQGLWTAARHSFVYPQDRRIDAAVTWGREEFTNQLNYLSQMLGNKSYLLGDQFTIADILIAQILLWATQQQKIDLSFDNIKAYLTRCVSRPKFRMLVARFKKGPS
jgi:glutathione S-transferase